jgi:hypothetical protein
MLEKIEKLLLVLNYVEDINEDIREDDDELVPGVTYDDLTDLKILLMMKRDSLTE